LLLRKTTAASVISDYVAKAVAGKDAEKNEAILYRYNVLLVVTLD
jgi:hypothetical protein